MKQSPANVMQPSELARLSGISVDTLRHYERNRLMPAAQRSLSGYRLLPRRPPSASLSSVLANHDV